MEFSINTINMSKTHDCEGNLSPLISIGYQKVYSWNQGIISLAFVRILIISQFTHHHLINWFLSNQITNTCSSLPVFFFKSKKSKISGCQGSKYIAKAPGRLFPPWSTYLAVALKTRSMGTRPFEVPLVWARQDKTHVHHIRKWTSRRCAGWTTSTHSISAMINSSLVNLD